MQHLPHPSTFALAFAVALTLAAPLAHAERADRLKPMQVEADSLRYDDLRQTSIFTGKVVATKGTILIRGARIEVRQDAEGFQHGVVTAEPGKRAFWRQKREGVDEYLEGEGETIEYDGKLDRVKFISRAEMRRLRGDTVADESSGNVITYDNTTDQFSVDGGVAGTRAANPGGRVRATWAPRAPAGAGAATPAPAGASLRPSPDLGGERR